ncbi:somatostatin receptor type 4-like [Exaiptasia diaphana]|uniref:G-protein coupled receptors family 1 profile domain-containing protein n=1 Tax=Exaiptasia diaphana TaxID=2652724 RepID=A0A913YEY9_EXADI|nr:somatostatin receptor type 4-like [Exaiptasia diaphana]
MVFHVAIFWIVFAFGLIGNSLVIFIISKKQRTSTDHLMLNLAVADLMYGAMLTCLRLLPELPPLFWSCPLSSTLNDTAGLAFVESIFTMLILSVERYFAVCRPYSFKKCFSKRNVKLMVLLSWFLSLLIIVPVNSVQQCFLLSRINSKLHSVVLLVFSMVTLVFLVILSTKIYVSLWCKQTAIQPTAFREIEERKKKKKVTLCVLAVTLTYILCSLPLVILYALIVFSVTLGVDLSLVYDFYEIPVLLTLVNSALDPYLFCFQSKEMTKLLKKLFLCKKEDQAPQHALEQQLP